MSSQMTYGIVAQYQGEHGLADSDMLDLLIEYISNQQSDASLECFLQEKADDESEERQKPV